MAETGIVMTFRSDILGRKPIRKAPEPEQEPSEDAWKGEDGIAIGARNKRRYERTQQSIRNSKLARQVEVAKLRKAGMGKNAIARHLNVTPSCVYNDCKEMGLG